MFLDIIDKGQGGAGKPCFVQRQQSFCDLIRCANERSASMAQRHQMLDLRQKIIWKTFNVSKLEQRQIFDGICIGILIHNVFHIISSLSQMAGRLRG